MSGPISRLSDERRQPGARVAWFGRALRALLLVAAALGVHESARWREAQRLPLAGLDDVRKVFPEAAAVGGRAPGSGRQRVTDAAGADLGEVVLTQPEQKGVRGYAGPSQVLAGLKPDGTLAGWVLLSTADTPEHAAMVSGDAAFASAWRGWKPGSAAPAASVSGSTLTAAAVAESLQRRLAPEPVKGSLKFPDEPVVEEARALFPAAASLAAEVGGERWRVLGPDGTVLGQVMRSAPWSDGVRGYQGATDVLIGTDPACERVTGVRLRRSQDNEPYAGYVREDLGFLGSFAGRTVAETAALDFSAAGVEGVSGATLTSYAVAESLRIRCAAAVQGSGAAAPVAADGGRWHWQDTLLALVTAGGVLMSFTPLRGMPRVRVVWQAVLVVMLGAGMGTMLALPLFAGWMAHGLTGERMPGLLVMALTALVVPWATGRQVYCHQVCPHGALQLWAGKFVKRKRTLPARWHRRLSQLPSVVLVLAFVSVACAWSWPLAALEPFDAWIPRTAAAGSLVLAVMGLAVSVFTPQAWCHYGCATGALLRYVRKSGAADRPGWRDAVAVACVALAWWPAVSLRGAQQAEGGAAAVRITGGRAFGTSWRVQWRGDAAASAVRDRLAAAIAEVDRELSLWRDDSVLAAFRALRVGESMPVPARVAALARTAAQLRDATGGAFDCVLPRGETLRQGAPGVRVEGGRLVKEAEGVWLDLTPLGEGAAIEAMEAELRASGLREWLIEFGGELRARGRWTAGIEGWPGGIVLEDEGLSTSGQRRAAHLVDGRSGRSVAHRTTAVSVRHDSSVLADGWATALAVLGEAAGQEVAKRCGLAALFLTEAEDRATRATFTAAWARDRQLVTRSAP